LKHIFFGIILIAIFAQFSFGQSVKIVPKKVVYVRKNAEEFEIQRKASVIYPQISNFDKNISAKISEQISYRKNFEVTLDQIKTELGIIELSYKINYNKNFILDMTLTQESLQAYPWTEKRFIVLDLRTGKRIKTDELFKAKSLGKITKMIRAAMKRELKKKGFEPDAAFAFKSKIRLETVKLSDLEGFSVSDNGITFLFDYDFNFASLADEPAGRYFFSWKQLKPYLKTDGLFATFAK
jgi:tRNA splicing endonuclease